MAMGSDVDLSTYAQAAVDVNYQWGGNDWLYPFSDGSRPAALSGNSIGSACANLHFVDGAGTLFSTATPPYDGTFEPAMAFASLQSGSDADGRYEFFLTFSAGGRITLNCWTVEFDAVTGLTP